MTLLTTNYQLTITKGFSLVEVILASALFAIIVAVLLGAFLYGEESTALAGQRERAVFIAEEGLEAVRNIRDANFFNLTDGTYGLVKSGSQWILSGTEDITDIFTRQISISTVDDNRKQIAARVTWQQNQQTTGEISLVTYLVNWSRRFWLQTTQADYESGSSNSVRLTNNDDGEVQLMILGNWRDSSILTTFDADGGGNVNDIDIVDDVAYVAASSTNGEEFTAIDISNVSNASLTEIGSVELGFNIYGVAVENGYAYLATASNSQELVVIRLLDYTIVNFYDLPGGVDAREIVVQDNQAYIVTANSTTEEFYVLDVSAPEGIINQLGRVEIGDNVNGVAVADGYAYLAAGADNKELVVIRLSDYQEVNSLDIAGSADMTAISVFDNTAYLTRQLSGEPEFYAVDISQPEGTVNIVGTGETADTANDVFIAPAGEAYVATNDDFKELYIFDIATFSEVGYANLAGSSDAYAVYFLGAYAYLGTTDNNPEISVVKGGLGGWTVPTLVGSYDGVSTIDANDVFILDNYAYLVTEQNFGSSPEFYIIDISDAANPTLAGSLNLDTAVNQIYVAGNSAYLATADDNKELIIIDILDKANPVEAGSYDADEFYDGLAVLARGTTVYLGTADNTGAGDHEFYIIDAGSPASATLLGSYDIQANVDAIVVNDDVAYLATGHNLEEFIILNIADPTTIFEEDFYDSPGNVDAQGVAYQDNTAYLVTYNNASNPDFFIFDVTNPDTPEEDWSAPVLKGKYDCVGSISANDIITVGNYVYLVTEQNFGSNPEFYIIDISDAAQPALTGSLNLNAAVNKIDIAGNFAYLATDDNAKELIVVDISDKNNPSEVGSFNSDEDKNGLAVFAVGLTVYLGTVNNTGSNDHEFYILDASLPSNIVVLGSAEISADVNDIYINGSAAYLATGHNLQEIIILDVSNPGSISLAGSYDIPGMSDAYGLDYNFNTAYLVTDNGASAADFFILDVSNPGHINLTGSVNLNSNNRDVSVFGSNAYVATEDNNQGLTIVDISIPNTPSELGVFATGSDANGVAFANTYAFVATENGNQELQVIDHGWLVNPYVSLVGSLNLNSNNWAITVYDDKAYVATETAGAGLTIVDVFSLSNPTEYAIFDTGAAAYSVGFDGTYAYLATGHNTQEMQIIGAGPVPPELVREGWFISSTYNSGYPAIRWTKISWTKSGTGALQFQLRTAPAEGGSPGNWSNWLGPTGSADYYTDAGGDTINLDHRDSLADQWIQYKAYFSGDGTSGPVLEDLTITYQ